jgi:hypothetical protein
VGIFRCACEWWDTRGVKKADGLRVAADVLAPLRALPYDVLVARFLDKDESRTVEGPSGVMYNVEVQAFWDSGKPGNLRVMASVDDGGWRAFRPVCDDFILSPDGSFIGE